MGFVPRISEYVRAARNPPDGVSRVTRVAVPIAIVDGACAGAIAAAAVPSPPPLGAIRGAGGERLALVYASREEEEGGGKENEEAHFLNTKKSPDGVRGGG